MPTIYVKPAQGGMVRFPGEPRRVLLAEGEKVPASQFWLRRLADGSVVQTKQPKPGKKEK